MSTRGTTKRIAYCGICTRQRKVSRRGYCQSCSDDLRAQGARNGAAATKAKFERLKQEAQG